MQTMSNDDLSKAWNKESLANLVDISRSAPKITYEFINVNAWEIFGKVFDFVSTTSGLNYELSKLLCQTICLIAENVKSHEVYLMCVERLLTDELNHPSISLLIFALQYSLNKTKDLMLIRDGILVVLKTIFTLCEKSDVEMKNDSQSSTDKNISEIESFISLALHFGKSILKRDLYFRDFIIMFNSINRAAPSFSHQQQEIIENNDECSKKVCLSYSETEIIRVLCLSYFTHMCSDIIAVFVSHNDHRQRLTEEILDAIRELELLGSSSSHLSVLLLQPYRVRHELMVWKCRKEALEPSPVPDGRDGDALETTPTPSPSLSHSFLADCRSRGDPAASGISWSQVGRGDAASLYRPSERGDDIGWLRATRRSQSSAAAAAVWIPSRCDALDCSLAGTALLLVAWLLPSALCPPALTGPQTTRRDRDDRMPAVYSRQHLLQLLRPYLPLLMTDDSSSRGLPEHEECTLFRFFVTLDPRHAAPLWFMHRSLPSEATDLPPDPRIGAAIAADSTDALCTAQAVLNCIGSTADSGLRTALIAAFGSYLEMFEDRSRFSLLHALLERCPPPIRGLLLDYTKRHCQAAALGATAMEVTQLIDPDEALLCWPHSKGSPFWSPLLLRWFIHDPLHRAVQWSSEELINSVSELSSCVCLLQFVVLRLSSQVPPCSYSMLLTTSYTEVTVLCEKVSLIVASSPQDNSRLPLDILLCNLTYLRDRLAC